MARIGIAAAVAAGVLMVLHGFAHGPAIFGSWGLVTIDEVSYTPNIWLTGVGDNVVRIMGGVWLLAGMSFIIAGAGLVLRRAWWPLMTAIALVLSIPMTMLWREDAFVGLMLNVAMLIGFLGWVWITSIRQTRFV